MPYSEETLGGDEKLLAPARVRSDAVRKGIGRDMEAARLKALGWDLIDIAVALRMDDPDDPQKSCDRVAAGIKRAMAAAVRFSYDEHRYMDLAGLEELERRLWQMLADKQVLVSNGRIIYGKDNDPMDDSRMKLEIMNMIASIKRDKAKLMGYTAPSRSEISIDTLDSAISELSRQVELEAGRAALEGN